MVSLIDRTNQCAFLSPLPHLNEYSIGGILVGYIVAGATRTLFLTDPAQQPELGILTGLGWAQDYVAEESLCVNTIQLYPEMKMVPTNCHSLKYGSDAGSKFQTRLRADNPCMRFTPEHPCVQNVGTILGVCGVLDSSPHVLTMEERRTLS